MINQPDNPALRGFRWRSIGPTGQGGRVDDFAVDEKNPSTWYIGYAVGGVYKTVNNGTSRLNAAEKVPQRQGIGTNGMSR